MVLPLYVVVKDFERSSGSPFRRAVGSKFYQYLIDCKIWSAFTEGETPVPIPNTEVKPLRADGSVLVRVCESRSVLL